MKRLFSIVALTIAMSSLAVGQSANVKITGKHKAKDEAAIQKVVVDAMDGWGKNDVEQAIAEYSEDAYWINAFGIEKQGKAEIKKFLAAIFSQPGFANRKRMPLTIVSIRFIRPDIASVHTYQESTGQLSREGAPIGDRKTHLFRIMTKHNGKWLTDSFQVMDVRVSPA